MNYSRADGRNEVPRSITAGTVSNFHFDTDKVFTDLDVTSYVYAKLVDGSIIKSKNLTQEDINWHGAKNFRRRLVYIR